MPLHVDLLGNAAAHGRSAECPVAECEGSIPLPTICPAAGLASGAALPSRAAGPILGLRGARLQLRQPGGLAPRPGYRPGYRPGAPADNAQPPSWAPWLQHRQCVLPCCPVGCGRKALSMRPRPPQRQAGRQFHGPGAEQALHQRFDGRACPAASSCAYAYSVMAAGGTIRSRC